MTAKKAYSDQAIFDEIEAEIAELEEDFGDLGLDDDDGDTGSSELDELDAAMAGTEFAAETAETGGMAEVSVLMIADGVMPAGVDDEEGIFGDAWGAISGGVTGLIKRKAKSLIKKIERLVRKAAKYRSCVPKVVVAVAAFKAGKYGTSLKLGWSAYRCIRAKS